MQKDHKLSLKGGSLAAFRGLSGSLAAQTGSVRFMEALPMLRRSVEVGEA